MSALREGALRLRARPGRTALAALGILAAAAMLGAAVLVAFGLRTGFQRATRAADLPDVIARFGPEPRATVDRALRALPNLESLAYRYEVLHVPVSGGGHFTERGAVQVVEPGRRGYGVVAGRDVRGDAMEVVLERGVADAWGVGVGDRLELGRAGQARVVGIGVSPDNVAFPLAPVARMWLTRAAVERRFGTDPRHEITEALIWVRDPARLDVTLEQARVASAGLSDLRFITKSGVRVLLDQAAGIIIALLAAIAIVALVVAGTMLAASARAEVQRSLPAIGLRRALGFPRRHVAGLHAAEALLLAAPAALAGVLAGALVASGPSARLLEAVSELPPGAAAIAPLALTWLGIVVLVTAASTWPAWRAAGSPPLRLLRGADVSSTGGGGRAVRGGFLALGARLALARRVRALSVVAVVAVSAGFISLLLAVGSLLSSLENDPGSLGKRYQLSVSLHGTAASAIAAIPGVEAAAPRYVLQAAASFSLAQPVKLIAYPGDHTRFEAPPLAAGRRLRGPGEAEVGAGLAEALGLRTGSTLALQLPTGREVRFRVSGIVRALDNDGRVAYVQPARLLAAGAAVPETVAVRLAPGADEARVRRELTRLGASPSSVGGATASSAPFLGTVAALVRAVAGLDAVVCLFALAQALALTARERRPTVSLLRAVGAGPRTVGLVFTGAAEALALPAAVLGIVLERLVLGPAVSRLAAGYVSLPLAAGAGNALGVAAGLALLAAAAAAWTARRASAVPVVAGLGEE